MVGGNLVIWKSKKQKVVALSSVEEEFRGFAKGITEIIWVKKLLSELNFPRKKTCKLFYDKKQPLVYLGTHFNMIAQCMLKSTYTS